MVDFDYMPTAALALFVNHLSILRNRRLRGRVKLRAVKLGGQTCGFSLLARLSFRLQSEWEVAGGITRRQWSHSPHTHRLSRNRVINAPSDAGSVSVVRLIGCHGDNPPCFGSIIARLQEQHRWCPFSEGPSMTRGRSQVLRNGSGLTYSV